MQIIIKMDCNDYEMNIDPLINQCVVHSPDPNKLYNILYKSSAIYEFNILGVISPHIVNDMNTLLIWVAIYSNEKYIDFQMRLPHSSAILYVKNKPFNGGYDYFRDNVIDKLLYNALSMIRKEYLLGRYELEEFLQITDIRSKYELLNDYSARKLLYEKIRTIFTEDEIMCFPE